MWMFPWKNPLMLFTLLAAANVYLEYMQVQ